MGTTTQRHILIVCALGQELQIIKSALKGQIFQGIYFHRHVCGVGGEKSMISLTEFFVRTEIQFDLVINIGIAGYIMGDIRRGDQKMSEEILEGEGSFPDRLKRREYSTKGRIVQCLRIIQGDANKELCVPPQYVVPGLEIVPLTSRYRVVRDRGQMSTFLSTDSMIAVDMEGYSIESVCDRWGYARMYLKVLYDEIGANDLKEYDAMRDTLQQSLRQLPDLLRQIL